MGSFGILNRFFSWIQNQQKLNQRQENCENWHRNIFEKEVFPVQSENGDNENFHHIESNFQNDRKNQQMLERENIQFAHAERDGRFQQKHERKMENLRLMFNLKMRRKVI